MARSSAGGIAAPPGAARKRQVQDVAFALVGMAPEEGIVGRGIGVDRGEEDIFAAGENVLRAVAVVIVDVEYRDPSLARQQRRFGADRGMVQIGIAAEIIAAGMMSWRTGKGEGAALAARIAVKARNAVCALQYTRPMCRVRSASRFEAMLSKRSGGRPAWRVKSSRLAVKCVSS